MELRIVNEIQLDSWLDERRQLGHGVVSAKGPAPIGATDCCGDIIAYPINIAWQDTITKEIFTIEYNF